MSELAVGQIWAGKACPTWGGRREVVYLEATRVRWKDLETGNTCIETREAFGRWTSTARLESTS